MNALNLTLASFLLLTGPALPADPPAVSAPNAADPLAAPMPIITATLPDNIIYWRLASFTPGKSWTDLAAQLDSKSASAAGIILDLRSNVAPDDYAAAAKVLGFFAPGDTTLSKYAATGTEPGVAGSIHLPIVVLTNNQTAGAAEALAACLKADGALVVGRPSRGGAAAAPVIPDIALTVDDRAEKGALTLIKDNHILDVIQESAERHRMSEAFLVEGEDPEWDDYLASLEQKPVLLSLPIIHDAVLIRALDSLKAIRLSQRSLPVQVQADASPPASSSSVQ